MLSFVILHFQDLETTKKSINSIKKIDGYLNSNLVIVDNCSPNNTGDKLRKIYQNEKNVYVLINEKNEGFAKGNNLGFAFAKNVLHSNTIIVMNNDVLIKQKDFITKLLSSDLINEHEVIAPDIINLNYQHQNPHRYKPLTNLEICKRLVVSSILKKIYSITFLGKAKLFILRNKEKKAKNINKEIEQKTMIIPHGSCVIYTKKWIKKENIAFVPKTFLLVEEDILFEYLLQKNYSSVYTPTLQVVHLEDMAIKALKKHDIDRYRFLAKHSVDSYKVLYKLRKKGI